MSAGATSWLALAVAFCLGFCAWAVPVGAYGLAYFFTMNRSGFGQRELLIVAGLAAAAVLVLPLALCAWRHWHQAAAAYAAGMVVGVGPLAAGLAWFMTMVVRP